MGKIVKYCSNCEEGFAERFGFCPNCGGQLEAFEMISEETDQRKSSSPKINYDVLAEDLRLLQEKGEDALIEKVMRRLSERSENDSETDTIPSNEESEEQALFSNHIEEINTIKEDFRNLEPSFENAKEFIQRCRQFLQNIKDAEGENSKLYLKTSGEVVLFAEAIMQKLVEDRQNQFQNCRKIEQLDNLHRLREAISHAIKFNDLVADFDMSVEAKDAHSMMAAKLQHKKIFFASPVTELIEADLENTRFSQQIISEKKNDLNKILYRPRDATTSNIYRIIFTLILFRIGYFCFIGAYFLSIYQAYQANGFWISLLIAIPGLGQFLWAGVLFATVGLFDPFFYLILAGFLLITPTYFYKEKSDSNQISSEKPKENENIRRTEEADDEPVDKKKNNVLNCDFLFKCPQTWDKLSLTENEDIRYCNECRKNVYFAETSETLNKLRDEEKCVAVYKTVTEDEPPEMLVGILVDNSENKHFFHDIAFFNSEITIASGEEERTVTSVKKEKSHENTAPQSPFSLLTAELHQSLSFAPGRQLKEGDVIGGEYVIEKVFGGEGKSGMGVVYLVKNRKLSEPIVLKTIQSEINDPDTFARFYKEIQAWISIGWHPNIVSAIFAEIIDDTLYIGADYIPPDENGRNNLTHYLESSLPISNHQILRWSAQFIYAMRYAQLKGLRAHRDIKPDNIMIDTDGNVKVTDFGLASLFENNYVRSTGEGARNSYFPNNLNLTEIGSGMGTITFMAPEQFEDVRNVDHRADIYAFGIILYMLLTGGRYPYHKPYAGNDVFSAFYEMHCTQPHQPIQSHFSFIVDKCLMKKPSERYEDYEELLNDFSKVANQLNISLPPEPEIKDDKIEELYMQALSFRGLKHFDKALEAISSYLNARPDSDSGWALKGRILLELNKIDEAIAATQKSVDLYPHNSTPWNNLGVMLDRIGNYKESILAYKKALEIDPANSGAWMNMTQPLQSLGGWDAITICLRNAFELSPTKKSLHFNAANKVRFMIEAGEIDEAFNLSKMISAYCPDNLTNWHNLGVIYQTKGNYEEAVRCFQSVEKLDPDDQFCIPILALLYAKTDHLQKAETYFNKAIQKLEQKDFDWGSLQNLGNCSLLLGRHEQAVDLFKEAARLSQGNASVLMDLGISLEKANRDNEAIKVFAEVLKKDSDNASAYNSLAFTQRKIGQFDLALHNYKEAINALTRKLVRNLINSRSNRIIKHRDIPHEHWIEYAVFGAFYLASLDENIKKVAWLTGEQAVMEERSEQHEGLFWIDKIEKGNTTRIFLPNYFNTFVVLLGENPHYALLIGGIGKVLQNQEEYSEAQSYFEEATYFSD